MGREERTEETIGPFKRNSADFKTLGIYGFVQARQSLSGIGIKKFQFESCLCTMSNDIQVYMSIKH